MYQNALFLNSERTDCKTSVEQFKKITRQYSLFNLSFLILAFLEIFFFLLFFSFFSKSAFLGLSLGILFFTGFSYFVLLFYFQGKKPEQLLALKENYLTVCKSSLGSKPTQTEYHLSLTRSIYDFVNALQNQELHYYPLPKSFKTLAPLLQKLSVWTHWKEVHQMKEMLLLDAINEHLQLIKSHPIDLEAHGSLATAYVMLANLYKAPEGVWVSPAYASPEMKQKYKVCMQRALEEFIILCHFSPENSWVHLQLASTYYALEQPDKAIKEYETLHTLLPQDRSILLQLGILYFQQGLCAQGLKIYEELLPLDPVSSAQLIDHYDAYLRT